MIISKGIWYLNNLSPVLLFQENLMVVITALMNSLNRGTPIGIQSSTVNYKLLRKVRIYVILTLLGR